MRIGIQTYGSRGDINPWIALGQGLALAGHQVHLYYTNYAGGNFNGYEVAGLTISNTRILITDDSAYGKVPHKRIYSLSGQELIDYTVKEIYALFEAEVIAAAELLCQSNDIFISNPYLFQSSCIAEKYAVPRINLLVECQFSPENRVSAINDHHINDYLLNQVNQFRRNLSLPAVANVKPEVLTSNWLNLLAYSHLFKRDEEQWGDTYQFCGYLPLEKESADIVPVALEEFIAAGKAPILFSMGSLAFFEGDNYDILDIFINAIQLSGCRAIIQADWKRYRDKLPTDHHQIFTADYIPHSLILPRCAGMVHHGGAGTTHSALLNGCPSIVIAYAWDQFYWGAELQRINCSPATLKRKHLDELQLAGALRQLLCDPSFSVAAADAKRRMKRERGVAKAVKIINESIRKKFLVETSV